MPLGSPYQGQQMSSLIEQRLRELERQAEEAGAQVYGPDLGEFMEGTEANVARNAQELERREAERERLRMQGLIAENKRDIPQEPIY
jgi:hypothetical protein